MKRLLFTLLAVGLLAALFLTLTPTQSSLAQRPTPTPIPTNTPRPTPPPAPTNTSVPSATNTPAPGGGNKDDGPPAPTPMTGVVQGRVYNYSDAAYAPNITVVLDGGGWQAQTVTTSDGHYIFAGLGSGPAALQLRLPPQAHSVMPDYPVHTGSPAPGDTNVGFYWGENPPIPVILSVEEESIAAAPGQPFNLTINVKNQSGGEATNGEVDVQLPGEMTALKAEINSGQIDFTDHRVWGRLEALPDGETAHLQLQLKLNEGSDPQDASIQIIFTYQEQITPQLIRVPVSPLDGAASTANAAMSAAPTAETDSNASDTNAVEAPAAASADESTSPEAAADTTESANSQSAAPEAAAQNADDTTSSDAQAASGDLIPTTGGQPAPTSPPWITIILSVVLIAGLGFAGFRAFSKARE